MASDFDFLIEIGAGQGKGNYDKGKNIKYGSVIEQVFNEFGAKVQVDLLTNLKNERHNASGQLSASIQSGNYKAVREGDRIVFRITLLDYYKYVDKGVRGRESSTLAPNSPFQYKKLNLKKGVILNWLGWKGINTQPKTVKTKSGIKAASLSSISQMKSLAFLIGRSIAKRGMIATNFYSDVINEKTLNQFQLAMKKALRRDVLIQISNRE